MDLSIKIEDYVLNIRAGAVIIHNNKVLLHRNMNEDHHAILGGRVSIGESSEETIKREILEELGKKIEITGYVATIENFFEMKNSKYHEIMFIHRAEFCDEEDKLIVDTIHNIEGRKELIYEWVDINELDKINLAPTSMIEILKKGNFPVHKIHNELK